jgi:AcrR family transcriptional regulator
LNTVSILSYAGEVPTAPAAPLTRGHKKRARTRTLLLDTALEVLAEQGEGFTVTDIAVRAGVSHGTFYNYFSDREQLVDALVPHVVEAFAARSAAEVVDRDPAARFAIISARALAGAVDTPERMRVILRLEKMQRALLVDGPLRYLRDDLADGRRSGRFVGQADDATLDVVLGALLLAARRIAEGETAAEYRSVVIGRLLQSLGVPAGEAGELARDAVASS